MCNVSYWPLCLPVVPKCSVNVLFTMCSLIFGLIRSPSHWTLNRSYLPDVHFSADADFTSCWLTELCDFSRRTMTVSNCGLLLWCLLEHSCYQHRRLDLVNVFHHSLYTDVYIFSSLAIYSFFRWYFTPIYKKDYAIFSFPLPASLCFSVLLFIDSHCVWFSSFLFLSYSPVFCSSCLWFCFISFFSCTFLACIRKY